MFITHRLTVDAVYAAARARLAPCVDTGRLAVVAHDSYQGVMTREIRVGPAGDVPGASKMVQVRFLGPVERGGATTIWLVYRRRWIGPWRATTRLAVALTSPADRYDATVPTGILTISVPGVARLLLSLRPTGAAGMGAAVTTLLRFARFFGTRVLFAFFPVGAHSSAGRAPARSPGPTATSE